MSTCTSPLYPNQATLSIAILLCPVMNPIGQPEKMMRRPYAIAASIYCVKYCLVTGNKKRFAELNWITMNSVVIGNRIQLSSFCVWLCYWNFSSCSFFFKVRYINFTLPTLLSNIAVKKCQSYHFEEEV